MSRNLSFVFNSAALPVNNHFEGLFLAAFAHLEDNTISLLALDVLFFLSSCWFFALRNQKDEMRGEEREEDKQAENKILFRREQRGGEEQNIHSRRQTSCSRIMCLKTLTYAQKIEQTEGKGTTVK